MKFSSDLIQRQSHTFASLAESSVEYFCAYRQAKVLHVALRNIKAVGKRKTKRPLQDCTAAILNILIILTQMFSIELKYAFQILVELERARLAGEQVTAADLRRSCGNEIMTFNNVIFYLKRSGWIDDGLYHKLMVDLNGKSLFDLAAAIGAPAAGEHDYVYGWSSVSLSGNIAAVEASRQMCEEYRSRLRSMSLPVLIADSVRKAKKDNRKSYKKEAVEQ